MTSVRSQIPPAGQVIGTFDVVCAVAHARLRGGGAYVARDRDWGSLLQSTGDHARLAAWYRDHLGMPLEEWGGAILKWPDDRAEDRGLTVWHVAGRDSQWFAPSAASFMINYRVDDLEALLGSLRQKGVEVVKGPERHENGKFAWILDPDGNKVDVGAEDLG